METVSNFKHPSVIARRKPKQSHFPHHKYEIATLSRQGGIARNDNSENLKQSLLMFRLKYVFCIICFFLSVTTYWLTAQNKPETYSLSRAHIIISQEANQLIDAGLTAQQQKNWAEALKNYQRAMELYPNYTVPIQGITIYKGVKFLCHELIGHMPEAGYQMYQSLFDPAAKSSFEQGIRQKRMDLLTQIAEQYPFGSYGLRALLLLGYHALEKGEYYQALSFFDEALKLPHLSTTEQTKLKQIVILASQKSITPSSEITPPISTEKNTLSITTAWRTYGGNNFHNQLMGSALAILPPHGWYFKIPALPSRFPQLSPIWQRTRRGMAVDQKYYRPYFPCLSGSLHSSQANIIYLATDNAVYAFSPIQTNTTSAAISSTGKPLWKFELPLSSQGVIPFEERKVHPCTLLNFKPNPTHKNTPEQGILYANLITSLGESERRLGYLEVKAALPSRALFAFDAQTGKILWSIGGDNSANDFLKRASFPMPPAGTGNNLYAIAIYIEHQTDLPEHYLVCLDPRSGKMKWRTFIASGLLETNLFNNPTRESIGSTLTLNKDSVFYCSHMGIVTALDQRTGFIKWIRKYHQYDITPSIDITPIRLPWHWTNNPIIYVKSAESLSPFILVTPVDSPYLYALDPETGEELWKWDGTELGRARYLIGVQNDLVFVSGERRLVCLNMTRQGKREWVYNKVGKEILVGKPCLTSDILYLPTNNGIKLLNISTGKLVNTWSSNNPERAAGNVFLWDNILVITSRDHLTVHYDSAKLNNWLLRELKQRPDDPYLLKQLGERYLQKGNHTDAIRYFKQAYQIVKTDPMKSSLAYSLKKLLYKIHLNLGLNDTPQTLQPKYYLEQARQWAPESKSFINATAHLVNYYQKQDTDLAQVITLYQDLLHKYPEAPGPQSGNRLWDWTKASIDKLIQKHGRAIYAHQEQKANLLWKQLLSGKPTPLQTKEAVLKLFQLYPNSLHVENKMYESCLALEKHRHYSETETTANLFITHFSHSENVAQIYTILVRHYERQDEYFHARNLLRHLYQTMPGKEIVLTAGQHTSVSKYVTGKLSSPEYQKLPSPMRPTPSLLLPLKSPWEYTNQSTTQVQPLVPDFVSSAEWVDLCLVIAGNEMQLLNKTKGTVLWKRQSQTILKPHFMVIENRLIILGKTEISALRIKTKTNLVNPSSSVIWHYTLPATHETKAYFAGWAIDFMGKRVFVTIRNQLNPNETKIIALDTTNGKPLWFYPWPGQLLPDISASAVYVILPTAKDGIILLDQITGKVAHRLKPSQPVATILYLPALSISGTIERDEQLAVLTQRTQKPVLNKAPELVLSQAKDTIETYDLLNGQLFSTFVPEWGTSSGTALIIPKSFSTNYSQLVFLTVPEQGSSPAPMSQVTALDTTHNQMVASPLIKDYVKYLISDPHQIYLVSQPSRERNKLMITAYQTTTKNTLSPAWTCPVVLTNTTSFSQVLLTEQYILLNCSSYDRNIKKWTPVVYIINKKDGTIARRIVGELKSQGQPEIIVLDGVLLLVQNNRITGYVGQ